jgi:hypothetical protein
MKFVSEHRITYLATIFRPYTRGCSFGKRRAVKNIQLFLRYYL